MVMNGIRRKKSNRKDKNLQNKLDSSIQQISLQLQNKENKKHLIIMLG